MIPDDIFRECKKKAIYEASRKTHKNWFILFNNCNLAVYSFYNIETSGIKKYIKSSFIET